MIPEPQLISVRRDRSRRHHFLSSQGDGNEERFTLLQLKVLEAKQLHPAAQVLAALVCYEAVLLPEDLAAAYGAVQTPVRWHEQVRIQWQGAEGNQDARFLCCITIAMASRVQQWPAFSAVLADLCEFLSANGCGRKEPEPLASFLREGAAWNKRHLPPALLGHVVGVNRMAALPISSLAREECGLAVAPELQASDTQGPSDDELQRRHRVYALAFEAALLGQSGSISGVSFLNALIDAIRPPVSGSTASKRLMVRQKLHGLADRLDGADEASALLFAYALELAESGTVHKEKLAPATPYAYLQVIGRDVQSALKGRHLSELTESEYGQMFGDLLARDPANKPRRAALAGFHRFLQRWWDAPALPHGCLAGEEKASIAANMVWPHEIARIHRWLDEAPALRVYDQVRIALGIAWSTMIRYSELIYLCCRNVIDEGEHIVVEIARTLRNGSEKSAAGRRRVILEDQALCAQVRKWLSRRSAEGAMPGDYLFGDPNDACKIACRGHMYYLLNILLKSATGEPAVSLHTLRHTRGTGWMADALLEDMPHEIRRLDEISVSAGHIGAHVTGRFYAHLFEAALRKHIDDALLTKLASKHVAALSGCSDVAVRQRLSRGRRHAPTRALSTSAKSTVIWQLLKHWSTAPAVSEGLRLLDPPSPLPPTADARRCSLETTIHILGDLSAGMLVRSVALKQGVEPDLVVACQAIVGQYVERFACTETGGITAAERGSRALRSRSPDLLGFEPDFCAAAVRGDLACIRRRAERASRDLLRHSINYWRFSLTKGEVALAPGDGLVRLAQFLHHCEFPARRIGVRQSAAKEEAQVVVRIFEAVLGIAPAQFSLQPRAGRPNISLVLGSGPERLRANGRGACMAPFHSLMLAVLVWQQLIEAKNEITRLS